METLLEFLTVLGWVVFFGFLAVLWVGKMEGYFGRGGSYRFPPPSTPKPVLKTCNGLPVIREKNLKKDSK